MGKATGKTSYDKSWENTTQSGQTGLDAQTQQWKDLIFQAAQGAGGGAPESVTGALDFLTGKSGGQQFMNPYQQQVIDQLNRQFEVGNQMTVRSVNDAATQARAFGGARHGIATGTALAENARNRDQQIAGLLSQGFEGATNRAMQAAGLGLMAGSPDLWRLNILRQGFQGLPYGQTYAGRSGRSQTRAGGEFGLKAGLGFGD